MIRRPITLFTGQWSDLPLTKVCEIASELGFDGLEIACRPEHLEPSRWRDSAYVSGRREILARHGLGVWTIANGRSGQATTDDPIDERHRGIVPRHVWGEGEPERVRARAAKELEDTARMAAALGAKTVVGFTGSPVWKHLAMFPPPSASDIEYGYELFAQRWNPILDTFEEQGVRFALEVHPGQIAFDFYTAQQTLKALDYRESFGFNWDPSHLVWQGLNPEGFLWEFRDRVFHVDAKDTLMRPEDGRSSILGSLLPWSDPRRLWAFTTAGHGQVRWREALHALDGVGSVGPISVEWEDPAMDRVASAREALSYLRQLETQRPSVQFDDVLRA